MHIRLLHAHTIIIHALAYNKNLTFKYNYLYKQQQYNPTFE